MEVYMVPLRCARVRRLAGGMLSLVLAMTGVTVVDLTPAHAQAMSVAVSGNQLIDGSGQPLHLYGINRGGSEYPCQEGWGVFDGPSDPASIAAIANWHANVVRVTLNEDCWLGINGINPTYAGSNYRNAIVNYVNAVHQAGMYAIVDLHYNAPSTYQASNIQPMPDLDHSVDFWTSVATTFKSDPAVLFDLYNEPFVTWSNEQGSDPWSCWLNGCTITMINTASGFISGTWTAVGMQKLVNTVRATGAQQPLLVGGLRWANDLNGILPVWPADPLHQLVASFHVYNFNSCADPNCWDQEVAPVAAQYPVITGEMGENDCSHSFIDQFMGWADTHQISYLGWGWKPDDCSRYPQPDPNQYQGAPLISDYGGTATNFGTGLRTHLTSLDPGPTPPPPTPTPTPTPPPSPTPNPTTSARGEVLDDFGNTNGFGNSTSLTSSATWPGWNIARGIILRRDGQGGYVLDGWGGLHPLGGAPPTTVSAYWHGWDIARGLVQNPCDPTGASGWVLDGWGGLHQFGGAPAVATSAYWPGWDIAVAAVSSAGAGCVNGTPGGYVLDGWGGVHPFGSAHAVSTSAYWPGWRIARGVAAGATGGGGWVLDGWGGLHPFGDAAAVTTSAYWPGWDIARAVAVDGTGRGVVLDGYGGLHPTAGTTAPTSSTYWAGHDVARGAVLTP